MSDLLRVLETPATRTLDKIQDLYSNIDDIEDEFSSTISDIEDWDVSIQECEDSLADAKRGKAASEKHAQQAAAKIQETREKIRSLAVKLISEIDNSAPAVYGQKIDKKKTATKSTTRHAVDELDTLSSREI